MDVVAAGLDVVALEVRRERRDHLVRIERGNRAAHRLRPTGGARRVLHELARQPIARPRVGVAALQLLDRLGAGHVAGGEAALPRHAGLFCGGGAQIRIARVAEE